MIHYPTLPAKTSCSIPSTHLQGFRNYIATILESYLGRLSIILSGLLWRHSVASVFHCEDLFLHWSSYFPGVNCWSHSIFYGAKYSSHHISSVLPGVNCLSHQMFYGANCSSHHVVSFFTGVNGLSHPIVYGATVQATIIFSFVMGVNCFSHLV